MKAQSISELFDWQPDYVLLVANQFIGDECFSYAIVGHKYDTPPKTFDMTTLEVDAPRFELIIHDLERRGFKPVAMGVHPIIPTCYYALGTPRGSFAHALQERYGQGVSDD